MVLGGSSSLLSTILALLVAQNFQDSQARSLPSGKCATSIQIVSDTPCRIVADLCGISFKSLFMINQKIGLSLGCDGRSSQSEVTLCCELLGEPMPDLSATQTTTQQVQSTAPPTTPSPTTPPPTTPPPTTPPPTTPPPTTTPRTTTPRTTSPRTTPQTTAAAATRVTEASTTIKTSTVGTTQQVRSTTAATGSGDCPTSCPDDFEPICGNDGVTYDNKCNLDMVACQRPEDNLKVKAQGSCLFPGASGGVP